MDTSRSHDIQHALAEVEQQHAVRVLYACESGSRAWGFASSDSDFDVRFIYVHPRDWYVAIDIEHRRDVIEVPIVDDLDVSGWDLRKALGLMRKSNPPLLEWLCSPIVYRDDADTQASLQALSETYFSSIASGYSYLKTAQKTYRTHIDRPDPKLKKYFYVLRPLLAALWIHAGHGLVPMEFERLVERMIERADLRAAIVELLERKRASSEFDDCVRSQDLDTYIEEQFEFLTASGFVKHDVQRDPEPLNRYFRNVLNTAAPGSS